MFGHSMFVVFEVQYFGVCSKTTLSSLSTVGLLTTTICKELNDNEEERDLFSALYLNCAFIQCLSIYCNVTTN